MSTLKSILVPVDGSSPSLAALAHAMVLAEDLGASIELLYIDDPDRGFGSVDEMAPETREQFERDLADAEEYVLNRLGDRASTRRVAGDTVRMIVDEAIAADHDLIVIGTHGRIGRVRQITGSVAEALVRNAPCPVLCVREPGEDYQSFADRRHRRPTVTEQVTHR